MADRATVTAGSEHQTVGWRLPLRWAALRWFAGLYLLILGTAYLILPPPPIGAVTAWRQPQGALLALTGLALLWVAGGALPHRVAVALQTLAALPVLWVAADFQMQGALPSVTLLIALAIGLLLAGAASTGAAIERRVDALGLVLGLAQLAVGADMLERPGLYAPVMASVGLEPVMLGLPNLLAGLALVGVQLLPRLPRSLVWAVHLAAGGLVLLLWLVSSRFNTLFLVLGAATLLRAVATLLLPAWGRWIDKLDGRALRPRLALGLVTTAAVPLLITLPLALAAVEGAVGADSAATLVGVRQAAYAAVVLVLAGAGLAAGWLAARLDASVGALVRAVGRVAAGEASVTVPAGPVRELDHLGAAVAAMAATIATRTAERERLLGAEQAARAAVEASTVQIRQVNEQLVMAHQRLQTTEERQRLALAAAGAAVWERDFTDGTVWWSAAHYALIDREPILGPLPLEDWLALVHPDDRPTLEGAARRRFETGEPAELEYRLVRPDGTLRWLRSATTVIRNEHGRLERLVGIVLDVTERKLAEAALAASEAGFRTIADAAPALVWVCTADGANVFMNARWYEYTGQSALAASGLGWTAALHPEDAAHILPYWERCRATGELYTGEVRYRRHDGTYRWHLFRGLPRRDASGAIDRWYGVSVDIDATRRAEREARFLDGLHDRLGHVTEPGVLLTEAAAALRDALGVAVVVFQEIDQAADRVVIHGQERGLGYAPGPRPLSATFAPATRTRLAAGEVIAIADVRTDPLTADRAAIFEGLGVRATLAVPLLREGEWRGAFVLGDATPRCWDDDLGLARAAAERVWLAYERARLLRTLRESEGRLRHAVELAELSPYTWEPATGLLGWDARLKAMWGLPADASVDYDRSLAGVHPDDRAMVGARVTQSLDPAGDGLYEAEFRVIGADGRERWVAARGRTTFVDGQPTGFMGVALETTARRRAELGQRLLAEAGRNLAETLDPAAVPDRIARLVVPLLADYCFVDLVDGATIERAAVAHRRPEQAALLRDHPTDPSRVDSPTAAALRSGRPRLVATMTDAHLTATARDARHLAALRTLAPISLVVAPLVARGRTLGILSLLMAESGRRYDEHDLALAEELAQRCALALDNARLHAAERAARAQAEAAVRARDEFLSIAAHELRTPVTGISAYAQRLGQVLSRGTLDAERLSRAVTMIGTASERLTALTADLLDISRLRTGNLPLRLEPVDLAMLVEGLAERQRDEAGARYRLVVERPPGGAPMMGDVGRLEQVVENLLSNAVKYSPDGGTVRVAVEPATAGWHLRVQDEGIGLPPGAAEQIFEPFGRAANATVRHLPGMGLGLAICRGIIERHGGHIWAESAGEGCGMVMTVWLPADIDQAVSPPQNPA